MKIRQQGKRLLCGLLLMLTLCGGGFSLSATAADSAAETTAQTAESESEEQKDDKTKQTVLFLAIFTVTCFGTAYVVARPNLRKLKEARTNAKEQTDNDADKTSADSKQ